MYEQQKGPYGQDAFLKQVLWCATEHLRSTLPEFLTHVLTVCVTLCTGSPGLTAVYLCCSTNTSLFAHNHPLSPGTCHSTLCFHNSVFKAYTHIRTCLSGSSLIHSPILLQMSEMPLRGFAFIYTLLQMCACHSVHTKVRGQSAGDASLPPPCGVQ